MCPSTPQWKINRGSSKSSDYFRVIYSVIFFNPLFHEIEGILDKIFIKRWSRSNQASKIWSWRFKNLEARKQKQTTTYIISEFPSSPELIWPRTSGHWGLAADQIKKEKRFSSLAWPLTQTESNEHSEPLLANGVDLYQWEEQTWAHFWAKTKDKSLPGRTSKVRKGKEEIPVAVLSALLW